MTDKLNAARAAAQRRLQRDEPAGKYNVLTSEDAVLVCRALLDCLDRLDRYEKDWEDHLAYSVCTPDLDGGH